MRRLTRLTMIIAVATIALGMGGCTSKRRSSSSASTVSASTSSSTTGTTSSTTNNNNTTVVTPPPPPPPIHPGSGVFTNGSVRLPDSTSRDWTAAPGDFNGDGKVDVAIGVYDGPARVLINTGAFLQERIGALPATLMKASDMHAVDLDRDGDLDLVVASLFEPVRTFLGDGAGSFRAGVAAPATNGCYTYKIGVGDLTGDGYPDVYMANAGSSTPTRGQDVLLINDGSGGLAVAPAGYVPARQDDSIGVAFFDLDGDQDLDVITGCFGTGPRLMQNDGTGRLTDVTDAFIPAGVRLIYSTAVIAEDLSGDGEVDLFFTNQGPSINGQVPQGEANTLLLRSGTRFVDASSRLPAHADSTFNARAVDVDADGDLDLVCSQLRAGQRLYLNAGSAVFTDATGNLPTVNAGSTSESLGLAVADFDGDAAPDILFLRRGAKPWLFLNVP